MDPACTRLGTRDVNEFDERKRSWHADAEVGSTGCRYSNWNMELCGTYSYSCVNQPRG